MIRRQWFEVSWNCLLRSAELGCKGKLFACHCWSLKDCCWLILVSVAGGCSPCLCFILQCLIIQGHRRVEELLSRRGLHVTFGPIKEINDKTRPGQQTQLSPSVRAIRCSPPIALLLQRSASEVCRLTVARDASFGSVAVALSELGRAFLMHFCFTAFPWLDHQGPLLLKCETSLLDFKCLFSPWYFCHWSCTGRSECGPVHLFFSLQLLCFRTFKRSQPLICLSPLWWFLFVRQS